MLAPHACAASAPCPRNHGNLKQRRLNVRRVTGSMGKNSGHAEAKGEKPRNAFSFLNWEFDLTLPIVAVLIIVLGWFMVINYERALREGAIKAFETTQLEIVRAAARSAMAYAGAKTAPGRAATDVEQEILKLFIAPVHLLNQGDAWMYAPDHVIFDQSSDFPDSYRGKSMEEIFRLQEKHGASHFKSMIEDVAAGREGGGWYVWQPDKGPEIAAWTPVIIGDRLWTIGLSTPLSEILAATGVAEQSRNAIAMMVLISIGGLGLAFTSTRNIIERRKAEVDLAEANADLEEKVKRGARELAAKSQALMESRLREKIKEKEAQIAYASGLIQSAGEYLHHFGNSLSGLEALLLKVRTVLDSTSRYSTALATIREAHDEALANSGGMDRTRQYLDLFEEALMRRAVPRLRENVEAMMELKERMIASIESQRKAFERMTNGERYVQPVDLKEILGNIVSERRSAYKDMNVLLETDIKETVSVITRKHPVIHGLNALIDLAAASARRENPTAARVMISLRPAKTEHGGAVIVITDNGRGEKSGPPDDKAGAWQGNPASILHGFMNFLNENNGKLTVAANRDGGEYVVELGTVRQGDEDGQNAGI